MYIWCINILKYCLAITLHKARVRLALSCGTALHRMRGVKAVLWGSLSLLVFSLTDPTFSGTVFENDIYKRIS